MNRRTFLRWTVAAATGMLGPAYAARAATTRWWSSLVWGVFENHSFTEVAGLPSHQRLAREGTVLTRYFAVSHPSGPNYRAMASGETWGDAEEVNTFHPSIASVAHNMTPPIPTFMYHLAGEIARRHNPFVDLRAPAVTTRRGLETFHNDLRGGLPETCLVYVGWDDNNDFHEGDAAQADRNLMTLLDTLATSPWFTTPDRTNRYPALFFCYDEDDGSGDNRVFAAWWGRGVRRGITSAISHTHFGFCRTMTENWGKPALGRAALEDPIKEPWE
jgi:hypothetical protein